MRAIVVIARDSLSSFLRQRLLLALAVVTLGATSAFGFLLSWQDARFEMMTQTRIEELQARDSTLTRTQAERLLEELRTIQQSLFFGTASLGGMVVSLLLFGTIVAAPLRRRETPSILSRPLSRSHYLLGRFCASAIALAAYWLLMSIVFAAFVSYESTPLPPVAHYATLLYFCKGLMVGSMVLALSLFVRPALAIPIVFVANSDWVPSSSWLYYVLPGDDRLGAVLLVLQGSVHTFRDLALAVMYALDITAVGLGIALLRFRRLDIP